MQRFAPPSSGYVAPSSQDSNSQSFTTQGRTRTGEVSRATLQYRGLLMRPCWLVMRRTVVLSIALFLCACFLSVLAATAQESRPAGWVVITVDDYRRLHDRAYPVEPEPSPIQATLTRVDYDLQIAGDLATGKATLIVDVLKEGWVKIPIPSGLLVREARSDNKLLSLVPSSGKSTSPVAAILSHPGRSTLLLDVALPVAASTGTESLTVPAAESGVTRVSVQLPRQGIDVQLNGGLLSEKSESSSGSKWVAYARGNEGLVFSWRRRTEDHRTTLPLRMRGSLTELVSLGEDSTSISAEVSAEVVQGAARDIHIQLPSNVTINQVLGATVADWEVKAGELSVTFLEPVEKSAKFVVNGEARLARDGLIDVPLLRLLNAERDTGGIAVDVLGAGEIKDLKSQGLEEADPSDLGDNIASRQSPSLAAFRFRAGNSATRALTVNVARYAQQAVLMANVEEARYQVLMRTDGTNLIQARYAVRNNQRNFVKIALPQGAVVWSASLAGKPVRPGQSPDGSLLLPLDKARSGEDAPAFIVEVLYLSRSPQWDEKGRISIALPALDLPISRTGLLVYYPPLFRTAGEPGAFRVENYAAPISEAFNPPAPPPPLPPPVASPDQGQYAKSEVDEKKTQALLDKFRTKSKEGKVAGILPLNVSFPAFGPSIYLVSELTSENQSPIAELSYQRDKKAGSR